MQIIVQHLVPIVTYKRILRSNKLFQSPMSFKSKWARNTNSFSCSSKPMVATFRIRQLGTERHWCSWRIRSIRPRKMSPKCRSICYWETSNKPTRRRSLRARRMGTFQGSWQFIAIICPFQMVTQSLKLISYRMLTLYRRHLLIFLSKFSS